MQKSFLSYLRFNKPFSFSFLNSSQDHDVLIYNCNIGEWSGEALRIMAGMTAGQLLQAQVAGYDEHGIPLVHLYLAIGAQVFILPSY